MRRHLILFGSTLILAAFVGLFPIACGNNSGPTGPGGGSSNTSTPTISPTPDSPLLTPTSTETPTSTATPSPSSTEIFTATPTPTDEPTASPTPTFTESPTYTPSQTTTPTVTATRTASHTATHSPTHSPSRTATWTPSRTPTSTESPSPTASFTPTLTPTYTPTQTPSHTDTYTQTYTPTITPTYSATHTPSSTGTSTATPTVTPTLTQTPYCTSPSHFGLDTGSVYISYGNDDRIHAAQYSVPSNSYLTSLSYYAGGSGGQVRLALYNSSNLLVVQTDLITNSVSGWNTFRVPNTYVPAGTYWLAAQAKFQWEGNIGSGGNHYYQNGFGFGPFPNTLSLTGSFPGESMMIYGSICPP